MRRYSAWLNRLYLAIAVALVWAGLHYLVDATVLTRGLDRPVLVLIGDGGALAALVVLVLLFVGAFIGTLLDHRRDGAQGLLAVGFGLGLWAWHGGTMDDWLILQNQTPGPPTAAPYWPLLGEYVYWALVIAVLVGLSAWRYRAASRAGEQTKRGGRFGALDPMSAGLGDGIVALIVTVVAAGVLMLVLTGPRIGHTYRGQVYFAVGVAFILAVLVARRVSRFRGFIWYLPAPLIVGIVGVLLAAARPGLGVGYENINVIPAWGLVRPLPIEMVGVGLTAILLTHRTASRVSSRGQG